MPKSFETPFLKFEDWFVEAQEKEDSYPDAFTVSTVGQDGFPSARTVLLKLHDHEKFTFFTNYSSQKGRELLTHPKVHMLFYWKNTEKQIRVRGLATKASQTVSDSYWETRALDSRLHAVLSDQSSEIPSDFEYKKALDALKSKHPTSIERPDHWGGIEIKPDYFEFWEEGEFRWHQRQSFSLNGENLWETKVLYP